MMKLEEALKLTPRSNRSTHRATPWYGWVVVSSHGGQGNSAIEKPFLGNL
jgi:hypothetical protein